MKKSTLACLLLALTSAQQAQANLISNGNFSDCSFSGWQKDTDGVGELNVGNDFQQIGAPDCAAQLTVDGAQTQAFFANTLYQNVDLMADTQYSLSFDLNVDSELTSQDQGFVADYFVVGLGDGTGTYYNANGTLGSLLEADIDGAQSYSFDVMLDDMLASWDALTLEFQLLLGADASDMTDFGASFLQIDNVAINPVNMAAVSEPLTFALFGLGLAGIAASSRTRMGKRSVL